VLLDQLKTLLETEPSQDSDIGDGYGSPVRARAAAVFLHAGWRSCGTWVWEKLREQPNVRAFYEPLHEDLARLDQPRIAHFRPDSWGSGHGESAPYFREYGGLLAPQGRGVSLYQRRFAFDGYFLAPEQQDDALEAYLRQLLAHAHAEHRLPVLKFCRSLGRASWMMRRFPHAFHAVMLRDPATQWRSARRQMEQDGNRYFVLAPFLILARNASHPLLEDAMRRLDVGAPSSLGDGFGLTVSTTWRHVQRLDWTQRYRGFLAVWAATAVAALSAGATVIDADDVRDVPTHRRAIEAAFASAGADVDLSQALPAEPIGIWAGTAAETRDAAAASLAALDFVNAHRANLPQGQVRALARKLRPNFTLQDGRALPPLTRAALPAPAPVPRQPAWRQKADLAVHLVFERATYPLRRAHYYLWRWLGWHDGPGVRRQTK
jgi:hypothetical protein